MGISEIFNKVEFVVVQDNGILRSPKEKPEFCKELHIVHRGILVASIKKEGKPHWFIRHFADGKANGVLVPQYDEYYIQISDRDGNVSEEMYSTKE